MKFVLVTGGSGFIGSHTSLVLLEKNYNLVIIDSFINSSSESIKRIAKITNYLNLRQLIGFRIGQRSPKLLG